MDLALWAIITIAVTVFVGSLMQRVSGMGLGLLGGPVLSLLVGPVLGILIINVIATINAIMQSISVRQNVDWRKFLLIGPVMIVGAIPGAWVVHNTPTGPLQVIVGFLVLVGLAVTTFVGKHTRIEGPQYAIGAGIIGGFMNTLAGIAGPAITVYAQASRWPQKSYAATLQPLFFLSGAFSLLTKELSADQLVFSQVPWYIFVLGVCASFVGLQVGSKISPRVSAVSARKLALTLAAAGALIVLSRGLLQMF